MEVFKHCHFVNSWFFTADFDSYINSHAYIHLITRLLQLYKEYKYTNVIVTVEALGAIPKMLEENLKKLINEERIPIVIQRIQTAVLLGTVKVCKTILKMP